MGTKTSKRYDENYSPYCIKKLKLAEGYRILARITLPPRNSQNQKGDLIQSIRQLDYLIKAINIYRSFIDKDYPLMRMYCFRKIYSRVYQTIGAIYARMKCNYKELLTYWADYCIPRKVHNEELCVNLHKVIKTLRPYVELTLPMLKQHLIDELNKIVLDYLVLETPLKYTILETLLILPQKGVQVLGSCAPPHVCRIWCYPFYLIAEDIVLFANLNPEPLDSLSMPLDKVILHYTDKGPVHLEHCTTFETLDYFN